MLYDSDNINSPIRPLNHKTRNIRQKILQKATNDHHNNLPSDAMEHSKKDSHHTKLPNLRHASPQKPNYISHKIDPFKNKKHNNKMDGHLQGTHGEFMQNIEEVQQDNLNTQNNFYTEEDQQQQLSNSRRQNTNNSSGKNLNSSPSQAKKQINDDKLMLKNDSSGQYFKKDTLEQDWNRQQQKKSNMFDSAKIYGKIPLINPDGTIPKHKIVGKPEWFIKTHLKQLQKEQHHNNHYNNNAAHSPRTQTIAEKDDDEKTPSVYSQAQSHFLNMNSLGGRSQRSHTFAHRKQAVSNHKKSQRDNQNAVKIDKDTLSREIKDIFQRLSNNRCASREMNGLMRKNKDNFGDMLILGKDERVFKSYNRQQGIWQHVIAKQTDKVNRNFDNSVILAADSYRAKQETINALDALQSETQRYGQNFWQLSLRQNQVDLNKEDTNKIELTENVISDDFPIGFNTFKPANKQKELEIIRKPVSHKLKSNYEGVSQFTTFKSGNYFQKKFGDASPEKIRLVQHLDDSKYDQLEIQGTSKLHSEITNLLEDDTRTFIKKNIQQKQPEIEEEIIELNYDSKQLTKMPAYSFNKFNIKY